MPVVAEGCRHKRCLTYVLPLPKADGMRFCAAYQGCYRNEMHALHDRHIMKVGEKTTNSVDAYMGRVFQLLPSEVVGKWTPSQILAHRSGRLKRRYENAFKSLQFTPLQQKDANVTMFIKFEKEWSDVIHEKTPRAIQYRTPRYTASLSQFLMPIEKWLFSCDKDWYPNSPLESRIFAKGMNSFDRAKRLLAMHRWQDTVWVLLDHSRFDANVSLDHIKWEEKVYTKLIAGPTEDLHRLMRSQYRNICYAGSGLKYTCVGKKMSGEYNTSLGDSLINASLIQAWIQNIDAEMLIDGDDSVVAMSKADYDRMDMNYFENNGWNTKVETTTTFNHVEFCQSRPLEIRPGNWRMVRNPYRTISRSLCTVQRYYGQAWKRYLTSIGLCEWYCGFGVPIVAELSKYLLRHGEGAKPLAFIQETYRAKLEPHSKPGSKEISDWARGSLALTWGIDIPTQLELERYFANAKHQAHLQKVIDRPMGGLICEQTTPYHVNVGL